MKRFIAIFMTLCMVLGLSGVSVWAAEEASWQTETPMPTARYGAASCAIGDKIYVIGGTGPYLKKVEIYDTKTNKWTTGKDMPTERANLCCVAIGDKIYAIGGRNNQDYLNTVEIYDTKIDSWVAGKSMTIKRCSLSASVVNNKIYVIGGLNDTNSSLNNVEIYDADTNTWATGISMTYKRSGLSIATIGSKIYAMGGGNSNIVEVYDTKTSSWVDGKPMPTKKSHFTICTYKDKIYVMGGERDTTTTNRCEEVEIFDTSDQTWRMGPSLITKRSHLSSAIVDGKIYAIGGYDLRSLSAMESLQVGTPQSDTLGLAVLLNPAETVQLSTSYNLDNNLNYTWSSTNEAVATVDKNGKVTAVAVGTADIYAQNADGSFKQFIPVRVTDAADELRLAVHLKSGEKAKLYLAEDAGKVTWKSLDETVATVSTGGQVTGVKQGLVILRGEIDGKSYQIYVRVNG